MNDVNEIKTVGLVGLGLMGQGICACLLAGGFKVIGYSRTKAREQETIEHISKSFEKLIERGIKSEKELDGWQERFKYVNDLRDVNDVQFVVETVAENLELKHTVYDTLESVIADDVVIASNTSGISLSKLQEKMRHKERFIGMHWAEPAEITHYLEISRAKDTQDKYVDIAVEFGKKLGKKPTVLNYDISGLISNRLMYAMMREAISLVESGVADVETVDRSFRNDIGWWAALFGPFRWMDITGLPIYAKVIEEIFPDLNCGKKVPELMKKKVESAELFYNYENDRDKLWEEIWAEFTHDIRAIVEKYDNKIDLSK